MQFSRLFNATEGDDDGNHWLVRMKNGALLEMTGSACFSEMRDWDEYVGWSLRGSGYDAAHHAPSKLYYFANAEGLTGDEYEFWMDTIVNHPTINANCTTSWSNFGFIEFDARHMESNYMIHVLGMLRAMREYPQMCKWAYAVYEATKSTNPRRNAKLACLLVYLSTQIQCPTSFNLRRRNGDGGHDPASNNIYLLDLALFVTGYPVIGGTSMQEKPFYDNISGGLVYHSVPAYGCRGRTLESLADDLFKFTGRQSLTELTWDEGLRKVLQGQVEQLEAVIVRQKANMAKSKAKPMEKVEDVEMVELDVENVKVNFF
jgi:hypothetical protein